MSRRAAAAFIVALVVGAPISPVTAEPQDHPAVDLPEPDLSGMEEPVRRRVEALRAAIDALRRGPDRPVELAEAYGDLGRHYHAFELLEAAQACYERAAALAPRDARWPYYVGLVQHGRGRLEEEVASYRRVVELAGEEGAVGIRLARALLELGRAGEAEAIFQRQLPIEASRAAAHFGLGKIAAERRDFKAAVEHFERALELQPGASLVHYPLGQAYRQLGEMEAALEHLKQRGREDVRFPDPLGSQVAWLSAGTAVDVVQALARRPEGFSDRDFLGFALSQLGDVEGAIQSLEEALRLRGADPSAEEAIENARLHYALGGLLVHRQRDDRAVEHFRAAVVLDATLLDAGVKLGNILARQRRFEEAVAEYTRVLELDPEHGDALLKRAAARMSLGQAAPAVADLERLLEIDPESSEGYTRLATIYRLEGDLPRALDLYLAAGELDLAPRERVLLHMEIGHVLRQQTDLAGAVEHYRRALELNPELPEARFYLAGALGGLGRYREAAEAYRQVVARDPQHGGARKGEVTALTLLGDHRAARQRLEEGLVAMPDDVELQHTLARHLASCPDPSLRDGGRSLELAKRAFEALRSFEHAATVAMALAELGRFEEAAEWQRALLVEAQGEGNPEELARLRRHLALYEGGEACCGDAG